MTKAKSNKATAQRNDADTPWKNILKDYFREILEYCLPNIAALIDWSQGYEMLDKELNSVARGAKTGKRLADALIKVWLKGGQELWVLCHLEVQGRPERDFPERMFIYYYRLRDRYQKSIISIAILTDSSSTWKPDNFKENFCGCSLEMRYLVIKILDFKEKRSELEAMNNPFAMVLLAQLSILETSKHPRARFLTKISLTRQLLNKGWKKEIIFQLLTFVDWLITLPEPLELEYTEEIHQIEEQKKMTFITTPERVGRRLGLQEGMQKGMKKAAVQLIVRQLRVRFGKIPRAYAARIRQADVDSLLMWGERVLVAKTLEEVIR